MDELSPCPWCGAIPDYIEGMPNQLRRHSTVWRIAHECDTDEDIRIETRYYRTKKEAIDAWNRRADK